MIDGSLVWAKHSGYPWWPGKLYFNVSNIEPEILEKKQSNTTLVYLFGIHNYFWIKDSSIVEFSKKYIDQEIPDNIPIDYYHLALKEINSETLKTQRNNDEISLKGNQNNRKMINNDSPNDFDSDTDDNYNDDSDNINKNSKNNKESPIKQFKLNRSIEDLEDSSQLLSNMKRGRESNPTFENGDEDDGEDDDEMQIEIQSKSKHNELDNDGPLLKKSKINNQVSKELVNIEDNIPNEDQLRLLNQKQEVQKDSNNSSSPSLSSKRVLLIKPPRSPAINSNQINSATNTATPNRNNKTPVIISNNQGSNSSPSIVCISNPLNSPPTRSVIPPNQMKINPIPTSPSLQSKLPQSVIQVLQKNYGNQGQSPVLLSSPSSLKSANANIQNTPQSPSVTSKVPITLSIPRFKKTNQSPSIPSSLPPNLPPPINMSTPTLPFQIPQQFRKNIFTTSPSLNNQFNRSPMGRIPQSPVLSVGGIPSVNPLINGDKLNLVEEEGGIPPNISQPPPIPQHLLPFLNMQSLGFNNNAPLNMETVISSPFSGKFSIKGSVDVGFQIECNIMGKQFQGFLSENPSPTAQSMPQPIPNLINPNISPPGNKPFMGQYRRNSLGTAEGIGSLNNNNLDYQNYLQFSQWFESFKQWQDYYLKNYQILQQQQQQLQQQQQQIHKHSLSPPKPNESSTQSTPHPTPKTNPTIVINNNNNKFETNNLSEKDQVINISENTEFLTFKQYAFNKLEAYQKLQLHNLATKQQEAMENLKDLYDKEKQSVMKEENYDEIISQLDSKYIEEKEKLEQIHKEQNIKMDNTHGNQTTKFYRVVENQWIVLQHNKSSDHKSGSSHSPVGSPALAPFISPSPSPSPLLSSFNPIGLSPSFTPSLNINKHQLNVNKENSSTNHTNNNSNNNNSKANETNQNNSNANSNPPPLSLSSNSPPRSPLNDKDKESDQQNNNSNNINCSSNDQVDIKVGQTQVETI